MNRYTLYCTESQTRKALELGAPIELESEYYHPTENDFKLDNPIPCKSFTKGYHYAKCPSAEQMMRWLEEYVKEVRINQSVISSWYFEIYIYPHEMIRKNCGYLSRKEATIAAIDAALEYLSNNKK